jgi:protein-tyrosine kinase
MTKIFEALKQQPREEARILTRLPKITPKTAPIQGPGSGFEEPMISLYQGLENTLPDRDRKVLQFVASRKGEGTSTIVREFSRVVVAEKFGKSVLVLDADQSHPTQHLFLAVTPLHYLEEVLMNGLALETAIYRVGKSGPAVSLIAGNKGATTEIFNSPEIYGLMGRLKGLFDFILIDSPPVTESQDALSICRKVDGVVLVLEAETTRWPVAERAKEQIEKNGGNILGVVFNKRRFYIPKSIYKRL